MRGLAESFQLTLLAWFDLHRRDLPWRRPPGDLTSPLDPYAVLVSEAMLQQTQVATVIDYFRRWMTRFPTVESLAEADEQEVLRLWQGLGYYNRARNLHRAAKRVVRELGGRFPTTVQSLRELPGVGPYTAGAIASIAFDRSVPLVDGNVQRVLVRLDALEGVDPKSPAGSKVLWQRASELVPGHRPGDFNSALMELGATVCSPRKPRCLTCPVSSFCDARHKGVAELLPPPKPAKATPKVRRVVLCLRRPDGRWLIERRPTTGRWAGLWQFPSREPGTMEIPAHLQPAKRLPSIRHALTHRRYTFEPRVVNVAEGETWPDLDRPTAWVRLDELHDYALPKPHLTLAEQLGGLKFPASGLSAGRGA